MGNNPSCPYPILDIAKLIMSFLVVGIHVGKVKQYIYPDLLEFLTRIAVPFFFTVSGFFLHKYIVRKQFGKPIKKYIKLYITWALVYFPFSVLLFYRINDYTLLDTLVHWSEGLFITGEPPATWHLWYVHSLIISILIIAFFTYINKTNARRIIVSLWTLSLILLSVRIIIDIIGQKNKIIFLSVLSMENYQNALFGGFPLILSGAIIAEYRLFEQSFNRLLYLLLIVVGYVLFHLNIQFFGILTSFAIVTYCLSSKHLLKTDTIVIRDLSKYVFFIHLVFVFLLRDRIENIWMLWLVSIILSLIASYAIMTFKKIFKTTTI